MARPMSAEDQELLNIIRDHGPIDLAGIAERATLLSDRSDIAHRLFTAKRNGHIQRQSNRKYVINGRNSHPAAAPPAPEDEPPQAALRTLADVVRKHIETPPTAPPDRLEPVTASTPTAAEREAGEHLHRLQTPRPHDALLMDDPIEHILRDAVDTAQRNLDAFVREAGSLARVLTRLIEARDKTVAALNDYRKTTA